MPVLFAVAMIVGGFVAYASAASPASTRPREVVLHPRWHVLVQGGVASVLVSGRYVYIGEARGSAAVFDEQTGRRVTLPPPAGCYFDNANSSALGGSWVVATCNPPPPGPRYLYQLYSIPAGTWKPLSPDSKQLFAFNPDCATGDPQCSASYTAIGEKWIEFKITCGYHCGPTTYAFQSIQSGRVLDQPPGWQAGRTEIPNLNSPTLTQTICKPLTVPRGFPDPYSGTSAGAIVFSGPFAVALDWHQSRNGDEDQRYLLEHCGTHLHQVLLNSVPGEFPFAINRHAVIWPGLHFDKALHGVFLPGRQQFKVTSLPARMSAPIAQQVRLTQRTLYVLDRGGRLYSAAAPLRPRK